MNKSLLKLFGKYSLEENGWRKEQLFHDIEYSLLLYLNILKEIIRDGDIMQT